MKNNIYDRYLFALIQDNNPIFLEKYINAPSLNRLKNISYFCGMDYASKDIYNFKEQITRYDHSLDVALLTWKFTKDKTATIAGLLHDIATPCFSHVIDYMNKDYEKQESTEKYTEEIIKRDLILLDFMKKDNIKYEDVIDFKKYSIVDNDRPKLCADRLDGLVLSGIAWTRRLNKRIAVEFAEDLAVYENEYNEKELGFKSKRTAMKAVYVNDEINKYCHSNADVFMMELLAQITKTAIEKSVIKYEDLYLIDEATLLDKMKYSKIKELTELINKFENIKLEDIPRVEKKNIKLKTLNPLVGGHRLKQ